MKWPSPEPAMGFKTDVLAFHKAQNQPNWSKKNQDAINFPKPTKPTTIWESLQPIRFGSIQRLEGGAMHKIAHLTASTCHESSH
ncbi:hypothetical protein YC2023_117044 [Brassica napus]